MALANKTAAVPIAKLLLTGHLPHLSENISRNTSYRIATAVVASGAFTIGWLTGACSEALACEELALQL